jgi:hypothetical protein
MTPRNDPSYDWSSLLKGGTSYFRHANPDFDMLHCHIALICYITFVLLHYFDVLHCHIALICYISFNMLHCFDILHYYIALICYIAFDMLHCFGMLHCHITLICYIAFVLLHCIDMLYCHIALICYTLLYCFCSSTFRSIWIHTTLLNDESVLSETSVVTWTNIVILLRFQLWTTWSRSNIWLSLSLSQSRWSFLLLCHCSTCEAFSDDRSNNTTLYFSTICIFDRVQDNKLRSLMKKMSRKKKQQSLI